MGKPKYTAEQIRHMKAQALKSIAILQGDPPHNTWSNISYGDGYFAASIKRQYGCDSIEEIKKWAQS